MRLIAAVLLPLLTLPLISGSTLRRSSRGFESQCISDDDHGWPRFKNKLELENDEAWASYFRGVYGRLPTAYPLCLYDLWHIDAAQYIAAGLNETRAPVPDPSQLSEGDLYEIPLGWYGIYHEQWQPLPDNAWVEITHYVYPTEWEGSWVWRTRGSGVWANIGRTKVFPTPSDPSKIHMEAIQFLMEGCTCTISPTSWPLIESQIFGCCAKEKGYDSIQFEPQQGQTPLGTFGITGVTEMVLTNLVGNTTCGVTESTLTPLRAGWMASDPCRCTNEEIDPECGLMAFPPPPIETAVPPLCQVQASDRTRACIGYKCKPTKCLLGRGDLPVEENAN